MARKVMTVAASFRKMRIRNVASIFGRKATAGMLKSMRSLIRHGASRGNPNHDARGRFA